MYQHFVGTGNFNYFAQINARNTLRELLRARCRLCIDAQLCELVSFRPSWDSSNGSDLLRNNLNIVEYFKFIIQTGVFI